MSKKKAILTRVDPSVGDFLGSLNLDWGDQGGYLSFALQLLKDEYDRMVRNGVHSEDAKREIRHLIQQKRIILDTGMITSGLGPTIQ